MAFHYDPIYNLAWLDQPGKSLPDQPTLWRFPLPTNKHINAVPAAVSEAVSTVMAKRPSLSALAEMGLYAQLRDLLEPIIKRAIYASIPQVAV